MAQLVLEINNTNDLQVILYILKKFGISIKEKAIQSPDSIPKEKPKTDALENALLDNQATLKEMTWEERVNDLFQFIETHPLKVDKLDIPNRDERNAR